MGYYSIFYSIIIVISLIVILILTLVSNKKLSNKDQDLINYRHKLMMKKLCEKSCDKKICGQYQERLNDYMSCKECKKLGMCWSIDSGKCINCSRKDLRLKCNSTELYGCENPDNFMRPEVPPINPSQTNCSLCWEKNSKINS